MNLRLISFITSVLLVICIRTSNATPSQTGPTGLLTVPTAETLDSENISVGIWGNLSVNGASKAFVLPASLTLGIGSFLEVYGSYPNLLLDGEEDSSDVNTSNLGMKLRFYGTRSSSLKIACDALLERRVSEDITLDGTTDYGGRFIVTYKTEQYGLHAYSGYMTRKLSEDDLVFGGGLELAVSPRARIIAEVVGARPTEFSQEGPLDSYFGFQYHLTPYLTVSLAGGYGLSDLSPEWRFMFGVSTSSGLGAYIRPVPKLPHELQQEEAKKIVVKPVKIIPISPLLVKAPSPAEPVSKIEVPLDPDKEEVVIRTYGQIILPPQRSNTRPFVPPPPPQDAATDKKSAVDSPPTYGFDVKGEIKDSLAGTTAKIDEKLVAYRKFRFPDIVGYFQQGQAELTPEAKRLLSEVAQQIRTDKSWAYLRIDGYTDGVGSQKYNSDLSLRRAIEVASYLIDREGVEPSRVFVRGMGSSRGIADNQSEAGRKMNRRFEILFLQRDVQN